jgi:hypothetical protein
LVFDELTASTIFHLMWSYGCIRGKNVFLPEPAGVTIDQLEISMVVLDEYFDLWLEGVINEYGMPILGHPFECQLKY